MCLRVTLIVLSSVFFFVRSLCETGFADEWKADQKEKVHNQEVYSQSILERILLVRSCLRANTGECKLRSGEMDKKSPKSRNPENLRAAIRMLLESLAY